jgi:hypothetical protein
VVRSSASPTSLTTIPVHHCFHLRLKCLTVLEEKPKPSQIHNIRCAISDMPPRGDKSALKRSRVSRFTNTYKSEE